jgi:hypothetical protein
MTHLELLVALQDSVLLNRTKTACIIAAQIIGDEAEATPNHANRMKWAKQVVANPGAEAPAMLGMVLAKNIGQTLASVLSIAVITDAILQTAVNGQVNTLAGVS